MKCLTTKTTKMMSPYVFPGLQSTQLLKPHELLDKLVKIICKNRNITEQDLMSKSRLHSLVMSRHEFCYLARNKTNLSLTMIGTLIGKNHATVLHSIKTWGNLLETDFNIRSNHMKTLNELNFKSN